MQLVRQLYAINRIDKVLFSPREFRFNLLLSFLFSLFKLCDFCFILFYVLFAGTATSTVYSVGPNAGKFLARHENCFWVCDNLRKSADAKDGDVDDIENLLSKVCVIYISRYLCLRCFCGCFRGLQTRSGRAIFGFLSIRLV